MRYIFAKLNTKIDGHPAGQNIRIQVDGRGLAISTFWRKRIKDSKIDGCLQVLKKKLKQGFVNA